MPPIRADLTASSGFEAVPAGRYSAVVFSNKVGTSNGAKTAGATTLNIRFKLNDGGSVFETFYIHPSTMWKFKQFAIAAGVDEGVFSNPKAVVGFRHEFDDFDLADDETAVYLDDILETVIGAEVVLDVTVEPPSTGRDGTVYPERNRINKIFNPSESIADNETDW